MSKEWIIQGTHCLKDGTSKWCRSGTHGDKSLWHLPDLKMDSVRSRILSCRVQIWGFGHIILLHGSRFTSFLFRIETWIPTLPFFVTKFPNWPYTIHTDTHLWKSIIFYYQSIYFQILLKSSTADLWHFGMDPDPDPDPRRWLMDPDPYSAIFVIDLQEANRKLFFSKVFLLITF